MESPREEIKKRREPRSSPGHLLSFGHLLLSKVSIKNSVFLKEVSIKVRLKSFANVLIASKGLKTL